MEHSAAARAVVAAVAEGNLRAADLAELEVDAVRTLFAAVVVKSDNVRAHRKTGHIEDAPCTAQRLVFDVSHAPPIGRLSRVADLADDAPAVVVQRRRDIGHIDGHLVHELPRIGLAVAAEARRDRPRACLQSLEYPNAVIFHSGLCLAVLGSRNGRTRRGINGEGVALCTTPAPAESHNIRHT